MRLLEQSDSGFTLTADLVRDIPKYAILSHTWGPDAEEVTFTDLVSGTGGDKAGYDKLRFCAAQAKRDGLRYFWVDTCCIDKSNNNELSTAINSMFRWYQDASRCYVYLPHISASGPGVDGQQDELAWESAFRASKWFTRGWTLQELLAPVSVEFFTKEGRRLGDKRSLEQQIHEVTGIAVPALRGQPLSQFDIEQRFQWAERRQTTREEDWAYSLLGVFGIFMPLIYGEGKEHAVRRLKKEIAEAIDQNDTGPKAGGNGTWVVPFERNQSFTCREPELRRLRELLFTGHATAKVAIAGLGGVGKTQLALELVYQTSAERKDCSLIWIPATSNESLEQAYLNAAKQLGISGWDDDKADIKRLVRDHLSSETTGPWLLVFDNADDVGMWVDRPTPDSDRLIDNLPKSRHGSIVFTTRDKKAAVKLAGRNVVEISEMDEAGGQQLLRNYLVDPDLLDDNQGDATALLDRLTYLPLAIVQAAMYINENGIGLRDYLSLLGEQEEDVIDLLSEDFEDDGRYRDLTNPVATTWLISFEQVRQRDPLAADYLSFMACVDAKDIPSSLLPRGASRKKETDAMGTLQGYSFVAKRSADSAITIHRLVHLATRNWLRDKGLLARWTRRAMARLTDVLNNADLVTREWRPFLPHAYYALGSGSGTEEDEERFALLHGYGLCLYYDGRYTEAETAFKRAVGGRTTKFGADHFSTMSSNVCLTVTYHAQGRWEDAESLGLRVMETSKRVFGEDHPTTLRAMNNLAAAYNRRDQLARAEALEVRVVEGRKRVLGEENPETLISMNNLADTWKRQGRWEEAEALEVKLMETRKRVLGEQHPDTLMTMHNLAYTWRFRGRLDEAESLATQVLEARKRTLGEEHPATVGSMNNLAWIWKRQGRDAAAVALMEECVKAGGGALSSDDDIWASRKALAAWKAG